MKLHLTAILVFLVGCLHAQINISNPDPTISPDYQKVLYRGVENPVIISTGALKNPQLSVENGKISTTDIPGKYLIMPGNKGNTTKVIFTSGLKKFEFEFRIISFPWPPEIDVDAHKNDDSAIDNIRTATKVIAYNRCYDFIPIKVDSFKITISDSTGSRSHQNTGANLDAESLKLLDSVKPGMYVTFENIWVSLFKDHFPVRKKLDYYVSW